MVERLEQISFRLPFIHWRNTRKGLVEDSKAQGETQKLWLRQSNRQIETETQHGQADIRIQELRSGKQAWHALRETWEKQATSNQPWKDMWNHAPWPTPGFKALKHDCALEERSLSLTTPPSTTPSSRKTSSQSPTGAFCPRRRGPGRWSARASSSASLKRRVGGERRRRCRARNSLLAVFWAFLRRI